MLLVDEHALFRQGMACLLASSEGVRVVGQAENEEGALALARAERPDVVVTEANPPLERAKKYLLRVLGSSPEPKVIVCTAAEEARYARELLGSGASACLDKGASAEQLLAAIRDVLAPARGAHATFAVPPKGSLLGEAGEASSGVLSRRELEVLILAARGFPNRRIAATLHLSLSTVKRHLATAYRKMGVSSRTEATRKALAGGLIAPEDITRSAEA